MHDGNGERWKKMVCMRSFYNAWKVIFYTHRFCRLNHHPVRSWLWCRIQHDFRNLGTRREHCAEYFYKTWKHQQAETTPKNHTCVFNVSRGLLHPVLHCAVSGGRRTAWLGSRRQSGAHALNHSLENKECKNTFLTNCHFVMKCLYVHLHWLWVQKGMSRWDWNERPRLATELPTGRCRKVFVWILFPAA